MVKIRSVKILVGLSILFAIVLIVLLIVLGKSPATYFIGGLFLIVFLVGSLMNLLNGVKNGVFIMHLSDHKRTLKGKFFVVLRGERAKKLALNSVILYGLIFGSMVFFFTGMVVVSKFPDFPIYFWSLVVIALVFFVVSIVYFIRVYENFHNVEEGDLNKRYEDEYYE